MSSYEFIIDGLRYSFSTLSGFDGCPYSFKLAKIDLVERVNNYYGEFGTLVHECMEKYFKGELESFELSQYYKERYGDLIVSHLPDNQRYLEDRYKEQGQTFFDFFYFDKNSYNVLAVEDNIEYEFF